MRPTVDQYFLDIAEAAAKRATCDRKHVGAVIAKDKETISTGYNGSPRGLPHCDDVGHLMKDVVGRESCVRTLHAESNAIDRAGKQAEGATLYCTVTPCYECAKRIINAGIIRVVVGGHYQSQNTELVEDLFRKGGVAFETQPRNPSQPWAVK